MTLDYIEVHIADHCNLNCKGCGHFSPLITNKLFPDFEVFKKDMNRLSLIYTNIKAIHILGGEPLLNPGLADFLIYSRSVFPKSNIYLVTNGTLLNKQTELFWETCKNNNIAINISYYPVKIDIRDISRKSRTYGLQLNVSLVRKHFIKILNIKGDSDPVKNFKICRSMFSCTFLKNGYIYSCAFSCQYKHFNDFFGENITTVDDQNRIDIHSHSAGEITQFLNSPVPFCKYCISKPPVFNWGLSERNKNEWIGEDDNSIKRHYMMLALRMYNAIKKMGIFESSLYRSFRNKFLE